MAKSLKELYNNFTCPNQVKLDQAMKRLGDALDDIITQHHEDMERLNGEVKEFTPTKTNGSGQ